VAADKNENTSGEPARGATQPPGAAPRGPPKPQPRATESQPNYLYVGTKRPMMEYAMMALTRLTQFDEVVVKARGTAISVAVDVAEVVTKRLGAGHFMVKSVKIDTEIIVVEGENPRNVSAIEIVVAKAP